MKSFGRNAGHRYVTVDISLEPDGNAEGELTREMAKRADPKTEELVLSFDCSVTPAVRGRCYGPPEDCYPDEPAEVEIEAAYFCTPVLRADGRRTVEEVPAAWLKFLDEAIHLTKMVEERAIEAAKDDDGPEPPDADDDLDLNAEWRGK